MASTLTWKDIATPSMVDYSRHSAGNVRDVQAGVDGFAEALNTLATAKRDRALADLEGQRKLMEADFAGRNKLLGIEKTNLGTQEELQKKAAVEEWGRVQSSVLDAAYNTALKGGTYSDLEKSGLFTGLSPRARALAGNEISNILRQGSNEGATRADREADNKYNRDMLGIQRYQAETSRMNQQLTQDKWDVEKPEKDPLANLPTGDRQVLKTLQNQAATMLERATGASYTPVDLTKVKGADVTAARNTLAKVNDERGAQGLPPIPDNVFNKLIAEGVDTEWFGFSTGSMREVFESAGRDLDKALAASEKVVQLAANSVNKGGLDTDLYEQYKAAYANSANSR